MTTPNWNLWRCTLLRKPDEVQELLLRGAELSTYLYRLIQLRKKIQGNKSDAATSNTINTSNDSHTTTKPTKDDDNNDKKCFALTAAKLRSLHEEDVDALQELAETTQDEWKLHDEEVTTGLEQLAVRFRRNTNVPSVPNTVFDHAMATSRLASFCSTMNSVELWSSQYPDMDLATVRALDAKSDPDPDSFPKFLMFAVGAFFYKQAWTDRQLLECMNDVRFECNSSMAAMGTDNRQRGSNIPLPRMGRLMNPIVRAEMLADLTYHVILYAQMTISVTDLEQDAKFLKFLPKKELITVLENAGIILEGNVKKSDLVVRLIAEIYDENLEWPDMPDMYWKQMESKWPAPCDSVAVEEESSEWDQKSPSMPQHEKSYGHYLELEKARQLSNDTWSTEEKSSGSTSMTKLSPASSSTSNVTL